MEIPPQMTSKPTPTPTPTTTTVAPDYTDSAGFAIWNLKTDFDVNGSLTARVVGVPATWAPTPDKKFYAQTCDNQTTGTFRWGPRVFFPTFDAAKAYVVANFKTIAVAKLFG